MPPKPRKKKSKLTEAEEELQSQLEQAFHKFQYENENDDEAVGMFQEESSSVVHIDTLEDIFNEIDRPWDPVVLSILNPGQRLSKTVDFKTVSLMVSTLQTMGDQEDDIQYLFETFSDKKSQLITSDSLALALKHLSIRESADKMALLMAFAHEQPFLQLILNEQTQGIQMSQFADKTGITYPEFRRTFLRCNVLDQ